MLAGERDTAHARPALRFGVISDIQYADMPDGASHSGVPRYYRAALDSLQRAVAAWQPLDLQFVIHLGDIIDGWNPKDRASSTLDVLVQEFDRLGKPHYHIMGNHCLYNLERGALNERLRMGDASSASYYSLMPAAAILDERNPNAEKNSPEGLVGVARRFVKFGGGASDAQMAWLQAQLSNAGNAGERVIVCSHLPLHPDTCVGTCLIWNYEEVLRVLQAAGNVVATFAGHTHRDGYARDECGIHHRVLQGVVETLPGVDCFGVCEAYGDRLEFRGAGSLGSATYPFRSAASSSAGAAAALA
ncbi:hypothetical protein WJX81_005299 [Elliptochloris bilobata]|uniref:Calcineurin-like phosphoesterase domain-containing protein n=1 Tax=Elliptochloris bilobata TaxID=381761 RepID=A0AAW1RBM7_9CHLO